MEQCKSPLNGRYVTRSLGIPRIPVAHRWMRVSPRGWKMEPAPGRSAGVERPCWPMPPIRPLDRIPRADAAAPTSAARFRKPRRVTVFLEDASFWPAMVCCSPVASQATAVNCMRVRADCKRSSASPQASMPLGRACPLMYPGRMRNSSQTVDTRHRGSLTCSSWREHRRW